MPGCPKVYHAGCVAGKASADWACPWHGCDVCGKQVRLERLRTVERG